jgi:uncharacterized protein YjbI with pentapeptide repeats
MEQQGLWERAERLRSAADEAARVAQHIYLSLLLLETYVAIIIWSTTDMQLLKVSPVTLPLLNVQLPIVGFYFVVPWLLVLFYFNLLLHLTFLAQRLHQLNAVLATFTEEAAREEQRLRLFPFPFSVMLIGRPARRRLRWLLGLMVLMTVILLPLLLLVWAQVRFLPYHHTGITWNHRAAVLVDLVLLWIFWTLVLMPGQGVASAAHEISQWREEQCAARHGVRTRFYWWMTSIGCLTLVTMAFSLCIAVLPEEGMEGWVPSKFTIWVFERPGAPFRRNLWLQEQVLVAGDPSAEVLAALNSGEEHELAQGLKKIPELILTNRDLRGANLRETLLAKADLRGANLKVANLFRAKVFASNLSGFLRSKDEHCVDNSQFSENLNICRTSLQGADLQLAWFWEANLPNAQFQGAVLAHVQMQGAVLEGAQLQGAFLTNAQLQGVNLNNAQLQGALLTGAHLQGATLGDAQLQCVQSQKAQFQGALLGHTRLQGADLQGAQLQGADLQGAQLQGAALSRADLQGADLQNSEIGSADFTQANLMLSNLQSLSSSPLDEKQYEDLEKILTHAINDERLRAICLNQIKAAVGQPDRLQQALPPEQVLCDDTHLFPSCLTKERITDYAHARASFLGNLGCNDPAIARGVVRNVVQRARAYPFRARLGLVPPGPDPMLMALAKLWIVIPEKNCPGWAALPAAQKITLHNWAAGQTSVP